MVFGNEKIAIPDGLVTDEFLIRPLWATDVELGYAAVMESKEFLPVVRARVDLRWASFADE